MPSEKVDNDEDLFDVPVEAPPAYDDVNPSPSRSNTSIIEKPREGLSTSASGGHSDRGGFEGSQFVPSSPGAGPSRPAARVFPATINPKVQNDIRETIRALVASVLRDVTSGKLNSMEVRGVLDSCANACMSHSLSLASILQERNIEGHSAVYWSIVSRSNSGQQSNGGTVVNELLTEFLSRAAPLSLDGISELRAACLASSDNSLFQQLRSVPGLVPLSGPDRMLLSGTQPQTSVDADHSSLDLRMTRFKAKEDICAFGDLAQVHEGGSGPEADAFRVDLHLKTFQRRMRVSGSVAIEFIARGRIWLLIFFAVPNRSTISSPSLGASGNRASSDSAANAVPEAALEAARGRKLTSGSWAVALALLDESIQCFARARMTITRQSSPPDLLSSHVQSDLNSKPPIILNLASSGSSALISLASSDDIAPTCSPSERARRESARARRRRMAQGTWEDQQERAKLAEKVLFSGIENTASAGVNGRELMYDGCPYIASDGSLRAVLEVQLTASPPGLSVECVIC